MGDIIFSMFNDSHFREGGTNLDRFPVGGGGGGGHHPNLPPPLFTGLDSVKQKGALKIGQRRQKYIIF